MLGSYQFIIWFLYFYKIHLFFTWWIATVNGPENKKYGQIQPLFSLYQVSYITFLLIGNNVRISKLGKFITRDTDKKFSVYVTFLLIENKV